MLLSYSNESPEHCARVLDLAQSLRVAGIDAWLDQFEPAPARGWPRWMCEQIERAHFIVLVCTARYRRRFEGNTEPGADRSVSWEGLLVTQLKYEGRLDERTLVPVMFEGSDEQDIPLVLRAGTHHRLPAEYEQLCRRLRGEIAVVPEPLGRAEVHGTMPGQPGATEAKAALEALLARARRFEGPGRAPARRVPYFTGREAELDALERLLLEDPATTVCVVAAGLGGVGKTTLAQQFVATRARELFPDGVAWLDGQSLPSELERVCRRFGLEDEDPQPAEAIEFLSARLLDARVLLVVDNVDPDGVDRKHIPRPGGACRTLVTSRSVTIDDELDARSLKLGLWSRSEGIAYLRARVSLDEIEDDDLAPLVEFVGRLPLGVRLVAAFLHRRRSLSPRAALDQLQTTALAALDKYASGGLHGVALTFKDSFEALETDGQRVLRAVAVCARQTRTEIVAAIAGVDDADEWLDELLARSLVELTPGADAPWGLHDIVRMFVLAQPGREAMEEAHLAWCRRHVARHGDPSQYQQFEIGEGEVRTAHERLSRAGETDDALANSISLLRMIARYQVMLEVEFPTVDTEESEGESEREPPRKWSLVRVGLVVAVALLVGIWAALSD